MVLSDLLVLLLIIAGTSASAVLLWRRSIRGRGLFAGVWLSFYGIVLTAMMLAHSAGGQRYVRASLFSPSSPH
ncbi:MAG: hypothetical protein M3466_10295 [Gemmatimonadota bacterium]|nr:hypothetical protein [Gemmatimonadota bacterium]